MKIILAPQSFKGSLKADEAAEAMARGVQAFDRRAEVVKLPVADGGAGTVRAMVAATGGKFFTTKAHDPLGGEVEATWGVLGDGITAVIEVAAASGLALVSQSKLNPMLASSYGTGELIRTALEAGYRRIIIGLGDSATVDGGLGMAQALGIRFLDDRGKPVPPGGEGLKLLAHIDISRKYPLLRDSQIIAACDVTNPLYGESGAAYVYAPQKGASPQMVAELESGLHNLAHIIKKDLGIDVGFLPGGGAAGGLGAGLVAFLGAQLKRGVDLVCESIGFDRYLAGADVVITGEGRMDYQTAFGKAAVGIARRAKAARVAVIAICGELGEGYQEVYQHGIGAVMSMLPRCLSRKEAMGQASHLLEDAVERALRLFCLGRGAPST